MTDQLTDIIGITDHELVALVDMNPTAVGMRFLDLLGLGDLMKDDRIVRIGQATLLVREVAGVTGDSIVAQAFAEAIATAITGASRVVQLTLDAPRMLTSRSIMVDGPDGGLLFDLTALGVHAVQPLAPGVTALGLVREVLDSLDDVLPLTVKLDVLRGDREPVQVVFTVATPEVWQMDGEQSSADDCWKRVIARV